MAKKLQLRRGTTTQHNSFTGVEGEVTVDTTKDSLVVHDGTTQGGHPIAKSSDLPNLNNYAALAGANFVGNVLIDNAQELRLGEADGSGTNFTAFKAQAQSGDITLTLPAVAPTANQILKADGSTPTTLTWDDDVSLSLINSDTFSGASTSNVNSATATKNYIDTELNTKQDSDADLTSLSSCQTGAAAALALLTSTEVAALDGFTGDKDDLNYAKDLKATGVTATEFDYLDNVTSNIQTQLNGKGVGDAVLATDQVWGGAQRATITALTSAASITINFGDSNSFSLTTGHASIAFANPSTEVAGQSGSIFITQGSTGCTDPTWGDQFFFPGGSAPTLTSGEDSIDRIDYTVQEAGKIHCVASLDIKKTS